MAVNIPISERIDSGSFLTQMRPALVRFFYRRCKNSAQAEDLAQDVIVRMLGSAQWTTIDQAKGYIFRTAANLWRDQTRRRIARGGAEVSWDENSVVGISDGIPIERVLLSEEALHRVSEALLQLTERTRDVFVLSRLEQTKYVDIAKMLGVSVSAVEKHMIRALAHLARQFDDNESI
jgi:RNA polymerase sigma factor (sigma-70 family)